MNHGKSPILLILIFGWCTIIVYGCTFNSRNYRAIVASGKIYELKTPPGCGNKIIKDIIELSDVYRKENAVYKKLLYEKFGHKLKLSSEKKFYIGCETIINTKDYCMFLKKGQDKHPHNWIIYISEPVLQLFDPEKNYIIKSLLAHEIGHAALGDEGQHIKAAAAAIALMIPLTPPIAQWMLPLATSDRILVTDSAKMEIEKKADFLAVQLLKGIGDSKEIYIQSLKTIAGWLDTGDKKFSNYIEERIDNIEKF